MISRIVAGFAVGVLATVSITACSTDPATAPTVAQTAASAAAAAPVPAAAVQVEKPAPARVPVRNSLRPAPPVAAPPAAAVEEQPDNRCTNLIDYSSDSRSNAEINSIGEETGTCPEPNGEYLPDDGYVSDDLESACSDGTATVEECFGPGSDANGNGVADINEDTGNACGPGLCGDQGEGLPDEENYPSSGESQYDYLCNPTSPGYTPESC